MPRVKRGVPAHARHKKIIGLARGHKGQRHRVFKRANESVLHSLDYAYGHRRERKGDFRKLWIARINAASRIHGITYSRLIDGLNKAGIQIDRKVLADLAVRLPATFAAIAQKAIAAIDQQPQAPMASPPAASAAKPAAPAAPPAKQEAAPAAAAAKEADAAPKEHAAPKEEHAAPKDEHAAPKDEHAAPKDEHAAPKEDHAAPKDEHATPKEHHQVEDIEGIGPKQGAKLADAGAPTVAKLLALGATRKGRAELATATGIDDSQILDWVNRADLMRIKGIGAEYSDLLEIAGVDSPLELAHRNPAHLAEAIAAANEKKKIVRHVPSEAVLAGWIAEAKELEKVVEH